MFHQTYRRPFFTQYNGSRQYGGADARGALAHSNAVKGILTGQNSPWQQAPQVQANAKLGPPNNNLEREADRVAENITSNHSQQHAGQTHINAEHSMQRTCAECQEEVQRKSEAGGEAALVNAPSLAAGAPLSPSLRNYFEPRFGYDFGHVRLHRDASTQDYAAGINAKAFTYGNHIGFASGIYNDAHDGKKLLAHELTHVIQQGQGSRAGGAIQRNVANSTNCPSGVNGAPPLPEMFLGLTETLTGSALTLAMIGLTFDIQSLQAGNRPQNSNSFSAYLARFGPPEQLRNGQFRDRFSRTSFTAENDAIKAELIAIKSRLQRIQRFFSRNIRYLCTSATAWRTVGSCRDRCGTRFAWVCKSGGAAHTIVICPAFWGMGPDQRAIGLIHEASHLVFGFGDPAGSSMTTRRRARNPVCFSGFVASVSGNNPPDPDCPVIAVPGSASTTGQPTSAPPSTSTP